MLNQLKIKNIKNILTQLLSSEQATKTDLVLSTGLSNTTVSDCINNMLKLGVVKTPGLEDSIGGRRSSIYTINDAYGCFLGIVINDGLIEIAVNDACNTILELHKFPIQTEQPIITLLLNTIESVISNLQNKSILSIGIGLNAVIDYDRQIVIDCPEFGWSNVHLKEIIERHFLIPTYIDHRINGGAFLEKLLGRAKNLNHFLFLLEGVEEKIAIYLDGEICRGEGNISGYIPSTKQMMENISAYMGFLNIGTAIIGFKTSGFKDIIDTKPIFQEGQRAIAFPMDEIELAKGLALMAEIQWFESIYFIL